MGVIDLRFGKIEVYVDKLFHLGKNIGLTIYQTTKDKVFVVSPLVFEEHEPFSENGPPTFQLKMEEAQQLMDRFWDLGLRPSEGSGSAGAMLAVQKHLEDFRALTFSKLNVEKPGR